MSILVLFLPAVFGIVAYACFLKLSALVQRFRQLSWARAFGFSLLMMALAIAGRAVQFFFQGEQSPVIFSVGFVLHLLLAVLLFQSAVKNKLGDSIRWTGALRLDFLALVFFLVLAGILMAVALVFARHFGQP